MKELKAYNKTLSMILKAALSVRAEHEAKEHNNFRRFDKERAVKRIRESSIIHSVFFTLN